MLKTFLLAVININLISCQIPAVGQVLEGLGAPKLISRLNSALLSATGLDCDPNDPNTAFGIDYTNNGTYDTRGLVVPHPYCRCQRDTDCNLLKLEWCPPNASLKCIQHKPCNKCLLDEYCIGTFRSRTIYECSKKKGKDSPCEKNIECLSTVCYNQRCTRPDLKYAIYNVVTYGVAVFQCVTGYDCFSGVCKVVQKESDGYGSEGKTVCTVNRKKESGEDCFENGECKTPACVIKLGANGTHCIIITDDPYG